MIDVKVLEPVAIGDVPNQKEYESEYYSLYEQLERQLRETSSCLAVRLEFPDFKKAKSFTCAYRQRRRNHKITDAARPLQRGTTVYIPGLAGAAPE